MLMRGWLGLRIWVTWVPACAGMTGGGGLRDVGWGSGDWGETGRGALVSGMLLTEDVFWIPASAGMTGEVLGCVTWVGGPGDWGETGRGALVSGMLLTEDVFWIPAFAGMTGGVLGCVTGVGGPGIGGRRAEARWFQGCCSLRMSSGFRLSPEWRRGLCGNDPGCSREWT